MPIALRPRPHVLTQRPGLGAAVLATGVVVASGALLSLALGLYGFTRPDPGMAEAVLTGVVPLTLLPLAAGLALFGLAWQGRFVREDPDPDAAALIPDHPEPPPPDPRRADAHR